MAYNGYLIKIKGISDSSTASSDYILPLQYMIEKSYKGTYSVLDGDSKRNGDGVLVRVVLPHKVAHCSVEIRPMSNNVIGDLMGHIQARYTKPEEKKCIAFIWVAEINDYVEAEFYVPDIEFTVKKIENGKVLYEQFTLEFIGY